MKKLFAIILAVLLIATMIIPAAACTETPAAPSFQDWSELWKGWAEEWYKKVEEYIPDCWEPLGVPEVTTAKYVHKTPYFGMRAHLEISWEEVEGAESYEVLITKADGETITYTTEGTSVYDTSATCPRVYIEATDTWASASVQIRAMKGDTVGEWSEAKKIGCDMLH